MGKNASQETVALWYDVICGRLGKTNPTLLEVEREYYKLLKEKTNTNEELAKVANTSERTIYRKLDEFDI